MSPSLSAFVDLCRAGAALVVLFGHLDALGYVPVDLGGRPNRIGHDAVIVFFVLSGLVIAHAAATSQRTGRAFAVARASRLYSVAVPAVLLGLALDRVGVALDPADYPTWQYPKWALHIAHQWLFLGESWTPGSIVPFSNVPYWSLHYEAWYYVLFGLATFARGPARVAAVAAVVALMGPKLWLLLPAWLLGVAVYRTTAQSSPARPAASEPTGRLGAAARAPARGRAVLIVAASACAYVLLVRSGAQAWLELLSQRLLAGLLAHPGYSRFFLADWVTAGLFTLTLLGLARTSLRLPAVVVSAAAAVAGMSFTLYLMHYPILMLVRATHWLALPGWGATAAAAAVVLAVVVPCARLFEHRREPWRRLFGALWDGARALRARLA